MHGQQNIKKKLLQLSDFYQGYYSFHAVCGYLRTVVTMFIKLSKFNIATKISTNISAIKVTNVTNAYLLLYVCPNTSEVFASADISSNLQVYRNCTVAAATQLAKNYAEYFCKHSSG